MRNRVLGLVLALLSTSAAPAAPVSLNADGRVGHGVGGTVTSIDNRPLAGGGGANASRWFDASRVIYQRSEDLALALVDAGGRVEVVDRRSANTVMANGGVWAAWANGTGVFASTGLLLPEAGLLDVGPEGDVAFTPFYQVGRGAVIHQRDGRDVVLERDGFVVGLQLLGAGRAVWTDGITVRTAGLPPLTLSTPTVWRPRAALVDGEWWIAYWTDGRGLVAHPFTSTLGYVLRPTPDAFAHDLRAVNGRLLAAFATNEAESPGSVVVLEIDRAAPRIDLRATKPPTDPKPDPKPTDPKPTDPTPVQEPASLIDALRAARGAYGTPMTKEELSELLNRVAWDNRAAGWGLLAKPAGNNCPSPRGVRVPIACDILFHRPSGLHFDVLGDAENAASPGWSNVGPMDLSRFVDPVPPTPTTTDQPPPPPPPPPPVDLSAVLARLDAMAARLANVESLAQTIHRDTWQALEIVTKLESRTPVDLAGLSAAIDAAMLNYEVNGKTQSDRLGLQHVVKLGITRRK